MKRLNKYLVGNAARILAITELAGTAMFLNIEFFEHMDIFTSSFSNFLLSIAYLALKAPFTCDKVKSRWLVNSVGR